MYYFCFFLLLPSEIPKLPTDPPVRGFPAVWKLLLLHDSLPGWVSIPNSFVFLFVFYILSYVLSKRMGCLSGCLVSSASIQKLFSGSCSAFKWSFDEFVVFLSCPIPLPSWDCPPYYSILNLFGGWDREWEMNHYFLNSHSILTQYTDCVTGSGPNHSISNNKYQGFLTLK